MGSGRRDQVPGRDRWSGLLPVLGIGVEPTDGPVVDTPEGDAHWTLAPDEDGFANAGPFSPADRREAEVIDPLQTRYGRYRAAYPTGMSYRFDTSGDGLVVLRTALAVGFTALADDVLLADSTRATVSARSTVHAPEVGE